MLFSFSLLSVRDIAHMGPYVFSGPGARIIQRWEKRKNEFSFSAFLKVRKIMPDHIIKIYFLAHMLQPIEGFDSSNFFIIRPTILIQFIISKILFSSGSFAKQI